MINLSFIKSLLGTVTCSTDNTFQVAISAPVFLIVSAKTGIRKLCELFRDVVTPKLQEANINIKENTLPNQEKWAKNTFREWIDEVQLLSECVHIETGNDWILRRC